MSSISLRNWAFTVSHGSLVESSTLCKTEPWSLAFFFALDVLVMSRRYVTTLVDSGGAELSCVALD